MKKLTAIMIVCMFILITIPVTVAMRIDLEPEPKTGDVGWTFLRGIITKPQLKNGGNDVTFRALFVHYRTHWMGTTQWGVLHGFQKITLPNDYLGVMRNHYVFAKFDGRLLESE
jgi:hypothetical protein